MKIIHNNMAEIDNVQSKVEKFFKLLSIDYQVQVQEKDDVLNIGIETGETGVLIGFHGETLLALQSIISLIVYKEYGEWKKLRLNIGDYLEQRELKLKKIADKAVDEVRRSGKSITLPYFSARERRIIHMYLRDLDDIETESIGEDEERRLVVFPKI